MSSKSLNEEQKIKKDNFIKEMQCIMEQLKKNYTTWDVVDEIEFIYENTPYKTYGLINVYNYGVMQGKRAERAKKKSMRRDPRHEKK